MQEFKVLQVKRRRRKVSEWKNEGRVKVGVAAAAAGNTTC